MGPFRRGLILVLLPGPAWAGACAELRPGWDGTPVSAWAEAVALLGSPLSLILLVATALALRFRSQWGALAVCVAWSFLVSGFTVFDPTGGAREAAMTEGCVGSPAIFILGVAALCVATVLYTGTPERRG